MGTTACQMTPARLIAEELGLDNGYKNRKVIAKAVGIAGEAGDGRTETWMIIEQDVTEGDDIVGRERFGVVALWGRTSDGWSHVKLVDFSMGPNGIPPRAIADAIDTVPCSGYDTPEWRESIKTFYATTIPMADVVAGQRFTVDGYRGTFTATGRTYKGSPVLNSTEYAGSCRFGSTKARKTRVRLVQA